MIKADGDLDVCNVCFRKIEKYYFQNIRLNNLKIDFY